MNPQDLARARFKPIRQALERIEKTEAAHAKSQAKLEQLRAAVGPAEHRDREALGQALVDGKPEPASEAEEIKSQLAQEERRAEALRLAVSAARERIPELVSANRGEWTRQGRRALATTQRRYSTAIDELEAARVALSDEASLGSWMASGSSVDAAADPLGGRLGLDAAGRPALSFT